MQTVIDATQKETAIDQQQHSCETLICQRYQTILRLLSSAAMASTWWRVRELSCPSTNMQDHIIFGKIWYFLFLCFCVTLLSWSLIFQLCMEHLVL